MAKRSLIEKVLPGDTYKESNARKFPLEVQKALFDSVFFFTNYLGQKYGQVVGFNILLKLGKANAIHPSLQLMLLEQAINLQDERAISILNSIRVLDGETQTKALQALMEKSIEKEQATQTEEVSSPAPRITREVIEKIMTKTQLTKSAQNFLVEHFFHIHENIRDSIYRILKSAKKLHDTTIIKMISTLFEPYIQGAKPNLRTQLLPEDRANQKQQEERAIKWLIRSIKRIDDITSFTDFNDLQKLNLMLVQNMEQIRLSIQNVGLSEKLKDIYIAHVDKMASRILRSQAPFLFLRVQVRLAKLYRQYPSSNVADVLEAIPKSDITELAKRELLPLIESDNMAQRETAIRIMTPHPPIIREIVNGAECVRSFSRFISGG